MKSTVTRFLACVSLGFVGVVSAQTSPHMEQMLAMMDAQYEQGYFKAPAKCLGVTEKAILAATKKSMAACFPEDITAVDDDVLDACMEAKMLNNLGVSAAKMSQCKQQLGDTPQQEQAAAEQHALEAFWEKVGDRELTNAEQDELHRLSEALGDAQREQALAAIESTAAALRKSAAGSEASITLPLYQNATIDAHYDKGYDFGNFKTLPVAMFSTQDQPKAVLAYYQKKLPGYKFYEFDGIGYMLLEKDPGVDFEFTDFAVYKNLPHVIIEDLNLQGAGANTRISLFYRK
ncbi:hypothetical protein P886_1891 [Alteromonadaceae bacterium 2753L.S.0a.02]|nr:hypothetical protein P886_1891 [Alteromonadaceae bacterium 2753L.S.0a.02]